MVAIEILIKQIRNFRSKDSFVTPPPTNYAAEDSGKYLGSPAFSDRMKFLPTPAFCGVD
jgi:hypothetical protein